MREEKRMKRERRGGKTDEREERMKETNRGKEKSEK